jgi:hypothetical protein
VTWGVFPGQEVVQTTIIERESFLTWKVRDLCYVLGATNSIKSERSLLDMGRVGIFLPSRVLPESFT